MHVPISQKVPEKPVAHVHVPSPVVGVFVVVQTPPFWHGFTEQNGALVVQVGPLKFGKHWHWIELVAELIVHVPLFWQILKPAGQAVRSAVVVVGAAVVVVTVVVVKPTGGTLQ